MTAVKVLLATHFFPPNHPGGTEAYTLGLALALQRLGHSPCVICAEDWGTGDDWRARHEDTVYEGLPVRRLRWNWQLAPNPFVYLYDNPEVAGHFARYVGEIKPDVVHVTSCYTLGAGIIRAAHQAGVPVFLTLTDFWFLCPRHTLQRGDGSLCGGPQGSLRCLQCMASTAKIYRALASRLPPDLVARGLLAVSHWPWLSRQRGLRGYIGDAQARFAFLRQTFDYVTEASAATRYMVEVFARNGYPAGRIRLSRYGLDVSWRSGLRPRQADGCLRIGYIGSLAPLKGVDLLVQAFCSLSGQVPAELKIYGGLDKDPLFTQRLRQLADGNPAVKFLGTFEKSKMGEVLSGLDLVVVPSVWYESAPLIIADAFAAGKPVIASNLPGLSELVEPEVNGLLFTRGDVGGLADAIRRFAADPALRERLQRGIRPVRTIEEEATEIVRRYQTAIERERN